MIGMHPWDSVKSLAGQDAQGCSGASSFLGDETLRVS